MLLQALKLAFACANIHIIFGIYKQKSFRLSLQNTLFFRHSGHKNGNKCIVNTISLYCQDLNK